MLNPILIYSKRERWGILSLVMLNLVLLLISFTFTTPKYELDTQELVAFKEAVNDAYAKSTAEEVILVDSLYLFNPNDIAYDDLLRLGFSKRVAKNMINYRSKGGRFYNAASVKKIYGMDSLFFEKIAPFIDIPKENQRQKYPVKKKFAARRRKVKSFPFDPNTATKSDLLALGFSERVAKNIVNYRQKGGKFHTPESLKRIYGMTDKFYSTIATNIQIEKSQFVDNQHNIVSTGTSISVGTQSKRATNIWPKGKKLEVNSASIEDWDKLPGIGQYFAKNLVRYREKLGGFYDLKQVAETYRLPDSTFQRILPFLEVDASKLQKFNPQTADFKTIVRHPYITYEQTKYIMKAQKGIRLMAKEDFLTVKIFTKEELDKVAPYFLFE